jgi:undecaprenyl-diphosphatase
MTNIQAVVLGVLEGLTEFLPISSTGHLTLASHFMSIVQNDQFIVFEIAIQLGAILAVLLFFWKKFFDLNLLTKLFVAFLPTGIIGLLIYKHIKILLASEVVVATSLVLGGIILILVEKIYAKKIGAAPLSEGEGLGVRTGINKISLKQSFILGLAQSIAMIPGVSRSGATIVAGLLMNIERKVLVEFTFLLAVPTMSAATLYSLYKHKEILTLDYINTLALGFISSFLVGIVVIKFFLNYIKKYDFIPFGVYRIIFGLILLLVLL